MKEFKEKLLAQRVCTEVESYIQSGNLVLVSPTAQDELQGAIQKLVEKEFGFAPMVLALRAQDFQAAIDGNPFPEAVANPKTLHLYFMESASGSPDLERLEKFRKDSERYEIVGNTFYLHASEGIGQSKLAGVVEKALGVNCTARNWNTVQKLAEMMG